MDEKFSSSDLCTSQGKPKTKAEYIEMVVRSLIPPREVSYVRISLQQNWVWLLLSREFAWQIPVNIILEYTYISKGDGYRGMRTKKKHASLFYKMK